MRIASKAIGQIQKPRIAAEGGGVLLEFTIFSVLFVFLIISVYDVGRLLTDYFVLNKIHQFITYD